MPVLIVSENTWPQEGFSRKRSIRPSSSVTTMPNSSGLSTETSPIGGGGSLLLVEAHEGGEVDVAERVAGDDEERVVELVGGQANRAGGPGRRLLDRVLDADAVRLAAPEVRPDRLRHVRHCDHDVLESMRLQELDDVLHARPPDDRDHGLRLVRGQRAQPGALPARHHDRLHRTVLSTARM